MDAHLWAVVHATTLVTETDMEREKRYIRMRALWVQFNRGAVMKRHTWQRLRTLSNVWHAWQCVRVKRIAAAVTLTRWTRQVLANPKVAAAVDPEMEIGHWRRGVRGLELWAWAQRRACRILRGGFRVLVRRWVMAHRRKHNAVARAIAQRKPKKPTKPLRGARRRHKSRTKTPETETKDAETHQTYSNKTINAVQKLVGGTLARTMREQLRGRVTTGYEMFENRELPFPYGKPTPWSDIISEFAAHVGDKWSGRVPFREFVYDIFYIMNSNLGTLKVVGALTESAVTLRDMQQGRVWLRCKVPRNDLESMSVGVARLRGKGMLPPFHLGDQGVMRVPVTLQFEGAWSVPVWVNVGALPFVETYMELLNVCLLRAAARKLVSTLVELTNPVRNQKEQLLPKLVPTLSLLLRRDFEMDSAQQDAQLKMFTNATGNSQRRWTRWWWQHWRSVTGHAYTRELGMLRFVTSTSAGNQMMMNALLTCSPTTANFIDLFRGKRYIIISPCRTDDLCQLQFSSTPFAPADSVARPSASSILGGPGPCCVCIRLAPDDWVWVNVTSLPHASIDPTWSVAIYMFLLKHTMSLLRFVWSWVCRRKLVIRGRKRLL